MFLGKNFINGAWVVSPNGFTSADLDGQTFPETTPGQVDTACRAAKSVFRDFSRLERPKRADFLRAIAAEMDQLADDITDTGTRETGLPAARLEGERARTTGQLKLFADLIEHDDFLDIRIEEALPDRKPLPRPDLRLMHRPVGPVAVFGASNFPLAFSTAGGDTASALAAGCPVIIKGHPAHPGTSELVCRAIERALQKTSIPPAVFQLLQGEGQLVGTRLVENSGIRAVGFTGSLRGGRALYALCHARPYPIPFYGELGSINPVFCLPKALEERAADIGAGWAASLTLGAGQFCTNPGVVVGIKGASFDALIKSAVSALKQAAPQKMLTDAIQKAYGAGVASFAARMRELTANEAVADGRDSLPVAFQISAQNFIENRSLQEEIFGSAGIFVECETQEEMLQLAENLQGQLTATLHCNIEDHALAQDLAVILEEKAGRLLCNGFPTGVEVSPAMMHGGPYPASTDARATSVGTLAIARWLRPVSFQNFPNELLHEDLRST